MALRSGDYVPNVLVVDHNPKFKSKTYCECMWHIGSSFLLESAYHKNINAKPELVNGIIFNTFRESANGRKNKGTRGCPTGFFCE